MKVTGFTVQQLDQTQTKTAFQPKFVLDLPLIMIIRNGISTLCSFVLVLLSFSALFDGRRVRF